jgi:hypothetical protein
MQFVLPRFVYSGPKHSVMIDQFHLLVPLLFSNRIKTLSKAAEDRECLICIFALYPDSGLWVTRPPARGLPCPTLKTTTLRRDYMIFISSSDPLHITSSTKRTHSPAEHSTRVEASDVIQPRCRSATESTFWIMMSAK